MAATPLGLARLHRVATDPPGEAHAALERDELSRLAKESGCRVLQTNVIDVNGTGKRTAVIELDCPGNSKAIVFLNAVARHDAHLVGIRSIGLAMRHDNFDDDSFGQALVAFVKARVRFVEEADEVFQSAQYTLDEGAGDCDDHARLTCALAIAGGYLGSRIVGVPGPTGKIGHVCSQLKTKTGFRWLETTIDAHFGEDPYTAARRLGVIKSRTDITGGK